MVCDTRIQLFPFTQLGYGLIILILTLMVKAVTLPPLTYKSFMSSAKMRVLRPQIHEIEKKYPPGNEQDMMMKRQQATMELYSRVGLAL